MRVILDTNIYISSLLFKGKSQIVYDYCTFNLEVIISSFILKEIFKTLTVKFKVPEKKAKEIIHTISSACKLVVTHGKAPDLCRDKDDNNILLLAKNTRADFIITGDKDLLVLQHYNKAHIISPAEFANRFIE